MSYTLQDYQQDVASEIDQSPSAPTEGGTDWEIRKLAANRSLRDFKNSREWDSLRVPFNSKVTVAGFATVSLPGNFDKMDAPLLITWDGSTTDKFPIINPSNNHLYTDSDKFVNIYTNSRDGKYMYIHSITLASGASISGVMYKSPQSLASAIDIIECNDPNYVFQRGLYYIYKGREDGRFPEAKVESEKILARMIENEVTLGSGYKDRSIQNQLEQSGFRIGRD